MITDLINKIAGTDPYDECGNMPGKFSNSLKRQINSPEKEKIIIESEIVDSVHAYVVSSMDVPKEEPTSWWKRFMAF